jgi:hypothetical protein
MQQPGILASGLTSVRPGSVRCRRSAVDPGVKPTQVLGSHRGTQASWRRGTSRTVAVKSTCHGVSIISGIALQKLVRLQVSTWT